MKSGWPILVVLVALMGGASWFDAHSDQVASAASAWMSPDQGRAPDDVAPSTTATAPKEDARTSTDSPVAFGSSAESK